jgi:hypothetical protein
VRDCRAIRKRLERTTNGAKGRGSRLVSIEVVNMEGVVLPALLTYERQAEAMVRGARLVDREALPMQISQTTTEFREAAYDMGALALDAMGDPATVQSATKAMQEAATLLARAADMLELLWQERTGTEPEPVPFPAPPAGHELRECRQADGTVTWMVRANEPRDTPWHVRSRPK